ncbi:hypothetical protein H8E88_04255 [candidate division KSB1 bacterium]|nr:hypothetical protein [candidate division KSB1 bacterium]
MRNKSLIINSALIIILLLSLAIIGCNKNEQADLPEDAAKSDTGQIVQPEEAVQPIDQKENALKKELKGLLAEVDKKQQELLDKDQELFNREAAIFEKETTLFEKENSLTNYRTISYIILIISIILFVAGLVMILIAKKKTPSKEARKAEREEKKIEKKAKREEKKSVKKPVKEEKEISSADESKSKE